jgi:hypothetical protein
MSHSQKISDFTNQALLQGSDLITFVRSGTNFNVSFTNFIASLGVTGTLTPIGDPSGSPVLNQPSAGINEIRNIESSKGIITSISPQDGVNVAANFVQGAAGVQLIKDLTLDQYFFRSIVAGTGINVSSTGDSIQITAIAAVASTKTVIISVEADFPTAVAGVITLVADTQYLLVQDVVTANRFVMNELTTIAGTESLNILFTYTGTGDMFTGVNVANRISTMSISCANGRILNWSTNVFKIFRMNDVTIKACDKIALMNSVGGVGVCRFTNVSPSIITTDGFELTGDWNTFLHEISSASISGGAYFNLGTATFKSFIADLPLINLDAGTTLLSGAASSANIAAGGVGILTRSITTGAGAPLAGITVDDALWNFDLNSDIANTRPDGLLSMQGNAINTTITTAGVGVLVAGTWVVETISQMSGTTAGKLTYDGGKNAKLPLTGSITVAPVSGGAQNIGIQIAINGVAVANSLRVQSVSPGNPLTIDVHWQEDLATTNTVEIFVSNESTTTDVLVSSGISRVN